MMDKFWKWLAVSPVASAVQIGAAAAVTFLIDNVANLGLDPAAQAVAIAVLTVALNAVNPKYVHYGRKNEEVFEDQ